MDLSDQELQTHRVAGEIELVLMYGTDNERASLLRTIEKLCGPEERQRLEEWADSLDN